MTRERFIEHLEKSGVPIRMAELVWTSCSELMAHLTAAEFEGYMKDAAQTTSRSQWVWLLVDGRAD